MRITKLVAILERLNDHLQAGIKQEKLSASAYYEELTAALHVGMGAETLILDSRLQAVCRRGFSDVSEPVSEHPRIQQNASILKRQFHQVASIRPPRSAEGLIDWMGPLTPGRSKPWAILAVRFSAQDPSADTALMETLKMHLSTHLKLVQGFLAEDHFELEFVRTLGQILQSANPFFYEHCQRVALSVQTLSRLTGLPEDDACLLQRAASIHDIGIVHVPSEILRKAAGLSPSERDLIRTAVSESYRFLKSPEFFDLEAMGRIIYCHYERQDGSGYPRGLRGDQIPKAARILAVANAWDAMTTPRPYQTVLGPEAAIEELKRCSGMNFDKSRARLELSCEHFDRDITAAWLEHIARSIS